ncbi:hypothetical protein, variant [Sphaeroforma arctica JP610]|nr:hypothetical protein, variant [Sphaeroforma arctica JP610]KNC78499.1 hypothetical protein, variant [Sphaeroforma arctica JP610]|eukprot:XP_014152401.1 hypothetical protein, variant [Sphaeroforma arctica JP610]
MEAIISTTGLDIRNILPFWMQQHLVKRAATAVFIKQRSKLYKLVDDIIKVKRASAEKGDKNAKADLMSFLIAGDGSVDGLTDNELRSNVITFIVAGHETTAVSLAWCFYSLAKEQSVQARLRDEIRVALSSKTGERLTYTEIEGMEYLNCVTKEILRLYPAAALVPRESINADVLGGYQIPPNTTIMLAPWVTHRSGDWDQPLKFIPERWIGWSGPSGVKRLSYMPFSSGPKMCIGHRLATLEMKCALIDAVNKFELKLLPGFVVKEKLRVTLRPEPSMTLLVSEIP